MNENSGVRVILNGSEAFLPRDIGFSELTKIAFPNAIRTELIDWEVDYQRFNETEWMELKRGHKLHIERMMKIHVTYTDKS